MSNIELGYSKVAETDTFKQFDAWFKKQMRSSAIVLSFIPAAIGGTFTMLGMTGVFFIGLNITIIALFVMAIVMLMYKFDKEWEGTVTCKKTSDRVGRRDGKKPDVDTIYIVEVETDDGKVKTIKECGGTHRYFDYLNVGDKIKHNPKFGKYYEKYDKTNDEYLYCAVCHGKNDAVDCNCKTCGAPLLK